MKHVQVDSYGPCLNNKEMPENINGFTKFSTEESFRFLAQYKFHLSFENAVCQDYMTEKVFRPLMIGSVPVYFGSPNISDFMPNNHSIISVRDFETPKKLAEYIFVLNENDTLYEEYFRHRKEKKFTNPKLIELLHKQPWEKVSGVNQVNFGYYMVSGYSCYICNKLHERYNRIRERLKDDRVELVPDRVGKYEHMGCPPPERILSTSRRSYANEERMFRKDEAHAIVRMIRANEESSARWKDYL